MCCSHSQCCSLCCAYPLDTAALLVSHAPKASSTTSHSFKVPSHKGLWLCCRHIPGPEGVRGRNSDNALILKQLGWEPTVKLADGLKMTYFWIKDQLASEQDHSAYAKSTIVQTSAPRELGSLREADGQEGFEKAKQAAREGFEAAGVTSNGHTKVLAA